MKLFLFIIIATIIGIGAFVYLSDDNTSSNIQDDKKLVLEHSTHSTKKVNNTTGEGEIITSLVPINYQDTSGDWHPYDTTLINSKDPDYDYQLSSSDFQVYFKATLSDHLIKLTRKDQEILLNPQPLTYINDLEQQKIANPSKNPEVKIEKNSIIYSNIYGDGIDLKFIVTSSRLAKELIIRDKSSLPQPEIDNASLNLTLSFTYPDNSDLYIGDDVWNGETVADITKNIAIKAQDINDRPTSQVGQSDKLFGFLVPYAKDSSNPPKEISTAREIPQNSDQFLTFSLSRNSSNLISVATPVDWLNSTSYPVIIDPSVDLQVGASGDDGWWSEGDSGFSNTSANWYVGYFSGTFTSLNSFARFTNITIPQGAKIRGAHLTLTSNESKSTTTVNGRISAIDADNASAPTTFSGAENATRTTAFSDWDDIQAFTLDETYNSVDATNVIQEIVDRDGWSSGNAIVMYMEDNGSTQTTANYRRAYSYDSSTTDAPQLHIEFSGPYSPPIEQTLTFQVSASGDDRRQADGTTTSVANSSGSFLVGTGNTSNSPDQHNLWRFLTVAVPQGSTISNATVRLRKRTSQWQTNQWTWYGEDADNVTSVTGRIDTRPKTTASTTENTNVSRTDGTWYEWDVTEIVQEITDRPGWTSGNNMALITAGEGTSSFARTLWYEWDDDTASAGEIEITYINGTAQTTLEGVNLEGINID